MPDPSAEIPSAAPTGFVPIRVPESLAVLGAARLLGAGTRSGAAKRMMTAAAVHGIDLSMMWATVDRALDGRPVRVREVCLAVPGSGRTVVLLVGEPADGGVGDRGHKERVQCIGAACRHLQGEREWVLAQTLPEPTQRPTVSAFEEAGFRRVGELATMRRGVEPVTPPLESEWPEGIVVRTVRGRNDRPPADEAALLVQALDRSYADTLDCPELCGLRDTPDVLESHRCTGEWDGKLWWLVLWRGEPHGCMLFSRIPEQGSVELVYLGLSPELRNKGLGKLLLPLGLSAAVRTASTHIMCAVDVRNAPARKLYGRFGFRESGRRLAMVKPLSGPDGGVVHNAASTPDRPQSH